jgi:hypothetical protein
MRCVYDKQALREYMVARQVGEAAMSELEITRDNLQQVSSEFWATHTAAGVYSFS